MAYIHSLITMLRCVYNVSIEEAVQVGESHRDWRIIEEVVKTPRRWETISIN